MSVLVSQQARPQLTPHRLLEREARTNVQTQCQNCSAPIQGDYCFQCGQSASDYDLPAAEFAKEFASEAFSLDSRLRNTLRPFFFEPGAVPKAYVEGHRARFVPPIRLYVISSLTMFMLLSWLGLNVNFSSSGDTPASIADSALVERADESVGVSEGSLVDRIKDRVESGRQSVSEDPGPYAEKVLNWLPKAVFVLSPVVALLLKLFYRRRLYVHHLVFSVYHHSFVFFVVAFMVLGGHVVSDGMSTYLDYAILIVPLYLALGMKRFYDESWVKTLAKFVLVTVMYLIVSTATLAATFVGALLTL